MRSDPADGPLRIAVSARLMAPDPERTVLPTKEVCYLEASFANWIMARGALPLMIPAHSEAAPRRPARFPADAMVEAFDGLLLQGGADLAPQSYGESPLQPEWSGDAPRDRYELELLLAFLRARKPVLGICRGCQLINVALGGSLYQDLATQVPGSLVHRSEDLYDRNFHEVTVLPGSGLAALYGGPGPRRVNSIHHQSIRELAPGLAVEARSETDGVIEAVRGVGPGYLVGIQWHPEFMAPENGDPTAPCPVLDEFLAACAERRAANSSPA